MTHLPRLFPSSHLAALLAVHPAPWRVARRANLPITRSESVDVVDADSGRVMELDSSTLADGIIEAINGACRCSYDDAGTLTLLVIEPWRGQEAAEAIQ